MKGNMSNSGETVIRTVCGHKDMGNCDIIAHVKNGVLVKVEPAHDVQHGCGHICARGLAGPKLVYHPDRLKYPLKRVGKRGMGNWQRVSWDEALEVIATRIVEIGKKHGTESIVFATLFPGTLPTVGYARLANIIGSSYLRLMGNGDSAGPCGDSISYGTLYGELYTIDFDRPGLCVVWGHNPAETYQFKWRRIIEAREKGARLVVIDPLFTVSASKADEHISLRPGTDAALALSMINIIIGSRLYDSSFVTAHTVGPFLVRDDNGLFLRDSSIHNGGTDACVVWDRRNNRAQIHDAEEIDPALMGAYTVAGISCKPAFQLLAELAARYPPEMASEITGIPIDAIRRLALDYATRKPVSSFRGWGANLG